MQDVFGWPYTRREVDFDGNEFIGAAGYFLKLNKN